MTIRSLLSFTVLVSISLSGYVFGDTEVVEPADGGADKPDAAEKKPEAVNIDDVKLSRTAIFDASEIKKLYKDSKAQNEKMQEGLPAHLNAEEMDTVTLKEFVVGGADIKLRRDLVEQLDPQPRRRLARIAELDPNAANEMLVTMRNDREFMSGQYDPRVSAGDPGRSANFTSGQIAGAFDKLITAMRNAKAKRKKAEAAENSEN